MSDDKVVSLGSKKKHIEEERHHHKEENITNQELVYCSFCGRPNTEVIK